MNLNGLQVSQFCKNWSKNNTHNIFYKNTYLKNKYSSHTVWYNFFGKSSLMLVFRNSSLDCCLAENVLQTVVLFKG